MPGVRRIARWSLHRVRDHGRAREQAWGFGAVGLAAVRLHGSRGGGVRTHLGRACRSCHHDLRRELGRTSLRRCASAAGETIRVNGWASTQHNGDGEVGRFGGVPVLWTPSTKTLWAPFVPLPPPSSSAADADTDADAAPPGLPLHQLRLSASSLRLHLCGQPASDQLGLPSPIGFSVDGLRIEIARAGEKPL